MVSAHTISTRAVALAWAAIVAAACVAISPAAAAASPSISVDVGRTSIYRNEPLTIDITMSGDYDDVSGPALDDFEVRGRSEGRSFSFGSGGSRSERTISLTVIPTRTGRLVVGRASLLSGGKVVASSQPVTINVRDEDAPAARQRQGRRSGMMSLFPQIAMPQMQTVEAPELEARLAGNGDTVYPGQPVILQYVLLTPTPPEYWSISVSSKPEMEQLVVREAPRQEGNTVEVRRRDGTWYETPIWKAAVTAIDAGPITIEPMILEAAYRGFNKFNVASKPVNLDVVALPENDAPAGFTPGVLGNFAMRAKLENPIVAAGESTTLSVEVSGTGNIAAVDAPAILVDEAVRVDSFATARDADDISIGDDGVSGTRTFRFLLTPGKKANDGDEFTVGVKPLVFFDYTTGTWGTATVEDMTLKVRGSALTDGTGASRTPLLGIVEKSQLTEPPARKQTWFTTQRVLLLMSFPVLFLAAVEIAVRLRKRLNRQGGRHAARKALRRAMTEVAKLEKLSTGDIAFWTTLEHLLRRFVSDRFDVDTTALTPTAMSSRVAAAGSGDAASTELLDLLEICSLARFANQESAADRDVMVQRVKSCLAMMDRANGGAA